MNTPAILKVASGEFSLLELETPLSANGPHGNPLTWGALQVDLPARLAWVQGFDPVTGSMCFARIAYDATFDGDKASVTYFFADQAGGFPLSLAKLLPGGRLILAGGTGWKPGVFPAMVDNFKAYSSAWIFCTEPPQKAAVPLWTIAVCILVIGGGHFADYPGATQAPQRAGSRRGIRIRLLLQHHLLPQLQDRHRQDTPRVEEVNSIKNSISVLHN